MTKHFFFFSLFINSMILSSCSNSNQSNLGPGDTITLQQRKEAATTTATTNSNCTSLNPFYWEIGDSTGTLVFGSTGDNSVTSTTSMAIASATKWIFGAYVVQRLNGNLDTATIKQLTMSSGYVNFGNLSCVPNSITTVSECFNTGSNGTYSANYDNQFYYNGGHFQKWGMEHSLGPLNESELVTEFQSQLGSDFSFSFGSPQLAGGITTTAAQYAIFLRKILAGNLYIYRKLGASAVCTNPTACATSASTPFTGKSFHYSLGHWVEDDPDSGDGAFSSPGLFGFYPWINSEKAIYGILARYKVPTGGGEVGEGVASQACGALIRKAYLFGKAQ